MTRLRDAVLLAAARERWGDAARPAASSDGTVRVGLCDLFTLDLRRGAADARLSGWDRDLTGMLRAPASLELGRLLDEVDRVIHDVAAPEALDPTIDRARQRGLLEAPRVLTWDEKRDAAVRDRARREDRDPAFVSVDHDELLRRVEQRWPDVPITRATEIDWVVLYRLRPYGTFRVGVGQVFRESIQGDILAATRLQDAYGWLSTDNTLRSVDDLLIRMDAWLRLTLPPAEILALPLTDAE